MLKSSRLTFVLPLIVVCVTGGIICSGQTTPTTPTPTTSREATLTPLEAAYRKIVAEANDVPQFEKPVTNPPVFSRPHPSLSTLGADEATAALDLMKGRLTNKPVLDVYVRWHLMEVYKKARPADRRDKGPALLDIYNGIQDIEGIGLSYKEEYYYEPRALWEEYKRLMTWPGPGAPSFTVGYPPFLRVVSGAAALAQMPPEQVAAYRRAVEAANRQYEINKKKAAEIFPKLKRVDLPENVAWNKRLYAAHIRVRDMQYMVRALRAEIIYELIKTGDPKMLAAVGTVISKHLEQGSLIGFDLTAFVYLAAFDGVLELYTTSELRAFANNLEQLARRFEGYRNYSGHTRDYGDYVFTLIATLRAGDEMVINQSFITEMTSPGREP